MTELLYLNDQNAVKATAHIESLAHDGVMCDKTIFYAQGGGQPSDTGTIKSINGEFKVTKVIHTDAGVLHTGEFSSGTFEVGDEVTMSINTDKRTLHRRLHSVAHIIDAAVYTLGLTQLMPHKGFHYPEGPYNEYYGEIETDDTLRQRIEDASNQIVKEARPISIRLIRPDDVQKECGYVPDTLPESQVRIVQIYSFPAIPCGGTHCDNTHDVGNITIRKIKSRAGKTRIAHSIET